MSTEPVNEDTPIVEVKPVVDDPILNLPAGDQAWARETKASGIVLHVVNINGVFYYYRPFTRQEWQVLLDEQDQKAASGDYTQTRLSNELEEAITLRCSLRPRISRDTIKAYPAGVISSLSDAAMMAAGFQSASTPIKL